MCNGSTLLFLTAQYGHITIVRELLDKGANIEAKNDLGRTPLCFAVRNGHEHIVQLLRARGALVTGLVKREWRRQKMEAKRAG